MQTILLLGNAGVPLRMKNKKARVLKPGLFCLYVNQVSLI